MLDFVWHLRGSAPLDGVRSDTPALERVKHFLPRQQKSVSEGGCDYLIFDNPFWRNLFGSNWLAMVIYDRGRFWIEQGMHGRRLSYDLRSLHAMVFCLFAAFTAFFFGLVGDELSGGLKLAAAAFAWLYGMNVLLALVRVPSSIRKALRGD